MLRARLAGHPLHPLFVHFPIALWFSATLWDGIGWWRPDPIWWQLSYWCLALGLIVALPAAITGFFEYLGLEPGARVVNVATAHMMIMVCATIAFGASWAMHAAAGDGAPTPWVLAVDAVGAMLLAAGGWLGGILVYRYQVGRMTDSAR
jgi:uncharacterized membrane protein